VQAQLQQLELTKRALDDATSHNVELQSLCDQYQRDAKVLSLKMQSMIAFCIRMTKSVVDIFRGFRKRKID
jgi:hypothetical protein